MTNTASREFSARVAITLELADGVTSPVAQLCDDFIITRHPFDVPPSTGVITLKVDDRTDRFKVFLTEGIDPTRAEQPILAESIAVA